MITYVNTVPIDEHRSINRFCLIRNFALSPVFDDYTRKVREGGRAIPFMIPTHTCCCPRRWYCRRPIQFAWSPTLNCFHTSTTVCNLCIQGILKLFPNKTHPLSASSLNSPSPPSLSPAPFLCFPLLSFPSPCSRSWARTRP